MTPPSRQDDGNVRAPSLACVVCVAVQVFALARMRWWSFYRQLSVSARRLVDFFVFFIFPFFECFSFSFFLSRGWCCFPPFVFWLALLLPFLFAGAFFSLSSLGPVPLWGLGACIVVSFRLFSHFSICVAFLRVIFLLVFSCFMFFFIFLFYNLFSFHFLFIF